MKLFHEYLPLIGPNLSGDPTLIGMIIRLSIQHLESDPSEKLKLTYLGIIVAHILPALSLIKSNSGLTLLFWNLLQRFPLEARFDDSGIYTKWERIYNTPMTRFAATSCNSDIRYITGRIAEDVKEEHTRNLAKVVQSNPILAIEKILEFMATKPNVIPLIAEAVTFFSPLELDVLSFCLVRRMMNERKKLESNGTTFTDWWKNLSKFVVTSLAPNPTSLRVLLKYLCRFDMNDLLLLGDLISFSSGIQWQVDLTDAQIDQYAANERSRRHLVDDEKDSSLLGKSMAELGILESVGISLAQEMSQLIYKLSGGLEDYVPDLKVISWQYDLVKLVTY